MGALTLKSVRIVVLDGHRSPDEEHISIVNESHHNHDKQNEHVADDLGGPHGKASGHLQTNSKINYMRPFPIIENRFKTGNTFN